jgi:DNA-binding transcriptional MerR regulator
MSVTKPQDTQGYRIGLAAQLSGISAANIRFYEAEKLISPIKTSVSSYRIYSDNDIHQLRFIRMLRSMDMSLDEVRWTCGAKPTAKPPAARWTRTLAMCMPACKNCASWKKI